jgi:hypothetical protein
VEARERELEILALTLLIWSSAAAGQTGSASGTLTLNGASTTLAHAYANGQPGFFDKKKEGVRILLSDVPLTDQAREDPFELIRMAREDRAHVVEVVLNAAGSPISGAIFAKAFDGMASLAGVHRFERDRFDRTGVAGRLFMSATDTFMNVVFVYDARFSAAIPRPPTAAETAAALASPPARAAAAYLAAVRAGKLSAFIATLTDAAASDYRSPDGPARFAQLRAEMPADTRVTSVATKPDGTIVTVEGHRHGIVIAYELKMVLDGGRWKVGQ